MLLRRLVDQADQRPGPLFHADRTYQWRLNIHPDTGQGTLHAATDQDGRGVTDRLPTISRSRDVQPFLGCDTSTYVLGTGASSHGNQCHAGFVDLHQRWADHEPDDPIAQAVATFYASGHAALVPWPEDLQPTDTIVLTVADQPVPRALTATAFWTREVTRVKGLGREDVCLVCGKIGSLTRIFPNQITGYLVPGAKPTGSALVTSNAESIGYDATKGLTHTPICLSCADRVITGLVLVLSNDHARTGLGQDARSTWWTTVERVFTGMSWLDRPPSPAAVAYFVDAVRRGTFVEPPKGARFCTLTVTGASGRISVVDWREYTIGRIREHIADWWDDHHLTTPMGPRYFGINRLVIACGRWDKTAQAYLPLPDPKSKKNDPHRPPWLRRSLLYAAYGRVPLPAALLGHLLHRIHADQHVDAPRVALLRLAHNRTRKDDDPMPPGLSLTHTEPAYLAGRLFALLAAIQDRAHHYRAGRTVDTDSTETGNGEKGSRGKVNTTYADRHLAGAMTNPRAALAAGQRDLPAWLKLLRHDRPSLAGWFEQQIMSVFGLLDAEQDFPAVADLNQQSQFIAGYWHQRSFRRAPKPSDSDTDAPNGSKGDMPLADEGVDADSAPVTEDSGLPTEGDQAVQEAFARLNITV